MLNLEIIWRMGDDFPWDVMGEFQNLSALLPVMLELEIPDTELKDNVARKLYKILEDAKAKQQTDILPVEEKESVTATSELNIETDLEEDIPEETIKFEINESPSKKENNIPPVETNDDLKDISIQEEPVDKKSVVEKSESIYDEKLERQKTLDYVKSYFKDEMNTFKDENKKNKLFSIILFVVLLVLLGVVYFLLSSDIGSNNEEIEKLKLGADNSNLALQENSLT